MRALSWRVFIPVWLIRWGALILWKECVSTAPPRPLINLYYIQFSTTQTAQDELITDPGSTPASIAGILNEDDSPFLAWTLPRPFLFLGRYLSTVFVSPNGAIHASKTLPCLPSTYFLDGSYTLSNTYYDVIAGYLTDLYPGNRYLCPYANLTVFHNTTRDSVTIYFKNFCYWSDYVGLPNSFRITFFFSDDHIEMDYDEISSTALLGYSLIGLMITGLRPPQYSIGSNIVYRDSEKLVGPNQWQTQINGVYPQIANFKSGQVRKH